METSRPVPEEIVPWRLASEEFRKLKRALEQRLVAGKPATVNLMSGWLATMNLVCRTSVMLKWGREWAGCW